MPHMILLPDLVHGPSSPTARWIGRDLIIHGDLRITVNRDLAGDANPVGHVAAFLAACSSSCGRAGAGGWRSWRRGRGIAFETWGQFPRSERRFLARRWAGVAEDLVSWRPVPESVRLRG